LLVAAIDIAGLAVAFPIGIGLALVVGVLLNYFISPQESTVVVLAVCFWSSLPSFWTPWPIADGDTRQESGALGIRLASRVGANGRLLSSVSEGDYGRHSLGPYAWRSSLLSALHCVRYRELLFCEGR